MEHSNPVILEGRAFLQQRSKQLEAAQKKYGHAQNTSKNLSSASCRQKTRETAQSDIISIRNISETVNDLKLMSSGEIVRPGEHKVIDLSLRKMLTGNQSSLASSLFFNNAQAESLGLRIILELSKGKLRVLAEDRSGPENTQCCLTAVDVDPEAESYIVLQHDGNLVQYDSSGQAAIWAFHGQNKFNNRPDVSLIFKDGRMAIKDLKSGDHHTIY